MDFGYKAEEILWLVESGILTLGYQSSSYLTDRVPELSFVDLPFLFRDNDHARGAMDGALGKRLVQAIESKCDFRILGWYENGFRHISNRVRTVRMPADLKGIRIRVLPSQIQARTFELLGATPMIMDLTDAIRMIKAGEIDAQENPLTNTVTYGVHKFHRFHTISNHFYISRPIFLHRPTFDGWPADLKEAMQKAVTESVAFQRELHVKEEEDAEAAIRAEGCEIVTLDAAQHDAFAAAVQPITAEARKLHGRRAVQADLARSTRQGLCGAVTGFLQSRQRQRADHRSGSREGVHASVSASFCIVPRRASRSPPRPRFAQAPYPNKPIRVLIPYAPGGLTDVVARYYGEHLRKSLGQNVIVENKPGASGIIAIEEMARAKPDGYTIMVGNISTNCLTPVLLAKRMHIDYDKRRADHRAARRRAGVLHGDDDELPAEDVPGVHRLRQGASGRRALRLRRHRRLSARQHRDPGQARRRARPRSTSRSRTAARASSRTSPAATPRCRGSTSPTRSA